MAFEIPTLADLIFRARAQLDNDLPDELYADNTLPAVLTAIQAEGLHGLHQHLAYLANQFLPDRANDDNIRRMASLFKLTIDPGATATGSVIFTGVAGSVIPAGSLLQAETDIEYVTDAEATIGDAGTVTVAVTAQAVGTVYNQPAETILTLINAIAGVSGEASADTAGMTGGADIESVDRLRQRVIERWGQPPQGGAVHDYEAWTYAAHPDITRVWVYPLTSSPGVTEAGWVTILFVTDNADQMIPDDTVISAVEAYIDERRPVTARVTVQAPTPVAVDFDFELLDPFTTAVKAAVKAELQDLFLRRSEPGGTVYISHIREAISLAAGERNYVLNSPAADITRTAGQISVVGNFPTGW